MNALDPVDGFIHGLDTCVFKVRAGAIVKSDRPGLALKEKPLRATNELLESIVQRRNSLAVDQGAMQRAISAPPLQPMHTRDRQMQGLKESVNIGDVTAGYDSKGPAQS